MLKVCKTYCSENCFSSYFVSYEFLMRRQECPGVPYTLIAGGCAGISSWLACYPIDVIKTHMQSDLLGKNAKYTGFLDCALKGFNNEGIRFFFRGLNSTLIRAFPMNAACFFVVSWVLELFNKKEAKAVNCEKPFNIVNLDNQNRADLELNILSSVHDLVRKIITDSSVKLENDAELSSDTISRLSPNSYSRISMDRSISNHINLDCRAKKPSN